MKSFCVIERLVITQSPITLHRLLPYPYSLSSVALNANESHSVRTIEKELPMPSFQNYIAGEWVDTANGATFENRNPAKYDEVIGTFPSATADDVKHAIAAAKKAAPGWANLPAPARGPFWTKPARLSMPARKSWPKHSLAKRAKPLPKPLAKYCAPATSSNTMPAKAGAAAGMSSPATPAANCSTPAANRWASWRW